jgi:hypothetical protein
MMRHIDPSLVGSSTRSQRDEVTFSFSYNFSNMKLLTSLHLIFFRRRTACGRRRRWLDTSNDGGQDFEEEEEMALQQEEEHEEEEEGHFEGEARHYLDEVVGVMDLPQDLHPHADTGLATSFALL